MPIITPNGAAGGGSDFTTIVKGADQSVTNSTALVADTALKFASVNGAQYIFEADIVFASPDGAGAPDAKFAIGEDAVTRGVVNVTGLNTADGSAFQTTAVRTDVTTSVGTAAVNRLIQMAGVYFAAGAQFGVLWALLNLLNNTVTVRAGSQLRYRRIV